MFTKKYAIAILVAITSSMQACNKVTTLVAPNVISKLSAIESNNLQKTFAKILVESIQNDADLRNFLKIEGLQQFDGDYDILYQAVKDKPINGGATLHDRLSKASNATRLAEIEENLPLLTIFIPDLPSGFSPNTWDSQQQIPSVAVSLRNDNSVPCYGSNNKEDILQPGQIPGLPTLVIKQNERIIAENLNTIGDKIHPEFYRNSEFIFRFSDEVFDNIHPKQVKASTPINSRVASLGDIDSKVVDAFNKNGADPNVQWQRDFVYYGISPTAPRGPLDRNYTEVIRTMTFSADALNFMADQSEDPKVYPFGTSATQSNMPWTDGRFEISISVLINAKNGVGPSYNRVISVNPSDLYNIQYTKKLFSWIASSVTPKEFRANVDILPWDLETYGSAWKFVIIERDATGTDTYTTQNSSTFGANFEVDIPTGTKVKAGAKFGTSFSTSNTVTHAVVKNLGDDLLGESILTFDRPVIKEYRGYPYTNPGYTTNEVSTGGQYGYVSLSVEPVRY